MITVKKLTVNIDTYTILHDLSVVFIPGTINAIIGNSGAGKTTLLKSIAKLIPVTSGTITLDQQRVNTLSRQKHTNPVGYVFQEFNLFTHLTVLENCIDPLLVHGNTVTEARTQALHMLQKLKMAEYQDRYPSQLSGGQQQRVAIARALCLSPMVLLLDEPTASLDPENSARLADILKSIAQQGLTVIFSSQDMNFVTKVFDHIYFMQTGSITETCTNKKDLAKCPHINNWLCDTPAITK